MKNACILRGRVGAVLSAGLEDGVSDHRADDQPSPDAAVYVPALASSGEPWSRERLIEDIRTASSSL
jgi:hypothetical protein